MSTNRNTKGQFARKTAPKKPDHFALSSEVKEVRSMLRRMEEKINVCMSRTEDLRKCHDSAWSKRENHNDWLMPRVVQIQRDIEQVRTLAHQTRTNSRANTVILNKTLAGVDLLKSGSSFMQEVKQHKALPEEQGLEDGDYCDASRELLADLWKMGFEKDPGRLRPFVNWHAKRRTMITHDVLTGYEGRPFRQLPPADFLARARVTAKKLDLVPEEPKAEPWVPKENEWVVCISGFQLEECGTNPRRVIATPWDSESVWIDGTGTTYLPGISCGGAGTYETIIRPATPKEIAEAERSEKLKKLVRGCRVDTPDGEGIYLGRETSAAAEGSPLYWVSLDREAGVPGAPYCFYLDQITPLT